MVNLDCSKKLLYVFNFIFWVGGAALLGFGIWMKVDPTLVNYLVVVNIAGSDPFLEYSAYIFMAAGALAVLVGFFGCCGAMRGNQPLLFVYIILLVLVMVAEVVGGVMALLYRGKIESELKNSMAVQIKDEYLAGSDVKAAWDFMQEKHLCCGGNDYNDYFGSAWANVTKNETVPASCCDSAQYIACQAEAKRKSVESTALYTQGCYQTMEDWIYQHSLIMMIMGIAIGAAQVFSFIAACCVRSGLKNHSYDSTS